MAPTFMMKRLAPALFSALAIGFLPHAAAADSYNLSLTATGPSSPPLGTGSFSIDTPPPGLFGAGIYLEGVVGSNLLSLSFTLGADTFDLSDEFAPALVEFDGGGNVSSISYLGLSGGALLSVSGLSYNLTGGSVASTGTITASVVPEPASMTVLAAGLIGLAALHRRRSIQSMTTWPAVSLSPVSGPTS
jgi:hypothetical protein